MLNDSRIKKRYILENQSLCNYGQLKTIPIYKTIKSVFNDNFDTNLIDEPVYGQVHVVNIHGLDLAKQFVKDGFNPVIVTTIKPQFDGSNMDNSENMDDDIINLRTNFFKTIGTNNYPVIGPEVVYNPCLTVFRDNNLSINPNEIFKLGLIVAAPLKDPILVINSGSNNEVVKELDFDEYYITKQIIETIFQTAISTNHDTIIIPDFGCKYANNPLSDIIKIFNMAILKYCHLFKYIIFSFHLKTQDDLLYYNYYSKEIIKPQDLVPDTMIDNMIDNVDIPYNSLTKKSN